MCPIASEFTANSLGLRCQQTRGILPIRLQTYDVLQGNKSLPNRKFREMRSPDSGPQSFDLPYSPLRRSQ